jgi:hypothetical protein
MPASIRVMDTTVYLKNTATSDRCATGLDGPRVISTTHQLLSCRALIFVATVQVGYVLSSTTHRFQKVIPACSLLQVSQAVRVDKRSDQENDEFMLSRLRAGSDMQVVLMSALASALFAP